ncbi:MAG: discoidin domain-containing protein [Planctomycetes bacterium]|nr:discoidin domain-containing protein [Planctomycetota bacterium]
MKIPLLTCLPFLSLVTVAFAQNTNVALGGTATQSSFAGFGEQPGFAIDGNRDGYWWNYSTTCTASTPGAWWQVVLPSTTTFNEVVIWNRADGWGERLSNFRVEIKNGATTVFSQDFLTTGGVVINGGFLRIKVPGAGVTANTVRLSNIGVNSGFNHHLQFAEVEVIRYGASREVNFARYGTATASSQNANAPRLIDGSTDGLWSNNRGMRTDNVPGSWLRVDVERRRLDQIRLWPVSKFQVGTGNFRVSIHDGATQVFSQDYFPASLMPVTQPLLVTPPAGTTGDSVRVTSLGPVGSNHTMEFAEIEVMQFADYTGETWVHGIGCRGSNGVVPTLGCSPRPALSATLNYSLGSVPAPGIALLAFGLSNTLQAGGPLPANLGIVGAPGCWLLNSLDVLMVAAPVAPGSLAVQLVLPNVPNANGLRMYPQAVVLDAVNPLGITLSNGLEQLVGF